MILLDLLCWQFLVILVLQEKDGVVKGLADIRRNLSSVPSWHSQLREGVSFPFFLGDVIGVGLGLVWECGEVACGNFMRFIGSGHEATELFVLEGDQLPLALGGFARFFTALGRRAALLHVRANDNKTRITQLCKCIWASSNL